MNSTSVLTLVIGLVLGGFTAALAVWLVLRARVEAVKAEHEADEERQRADLAQLRAEGSDARAAIERASAETERARASAARADAEKSGVYAQLADLRAQVGRAEAERDAAVARAEELAADRETMTDQFKLLSAQTLERQGKAADATAEQRLKQTEALLTPVRETLESFNARLAEVEKERVRMTTDLRNQVAAVKLTGDELRRETTALVTALRKPQVRGAWGEMQLKRVVEIAGMVEHCDFIQQHTAEGVDGRIRPDMLVTLSDGKFVYVDSKMPLTSFLDAQETDDPAVRDRCLHLFAKNVKSHVDALSGKQYWRSSDATPEFVILFMPSEALAAEALQQMPELHEYAAGKDVVIATPTTLIAMLRAVSYGWKQARLAGNAAEVAQLGQELYERLATMGGHVEKLGRALGASVKAYNQTVASLESRVFVSARKFADLKVTAKELGEVTGVPEAVRPLTAPELVAPPAGVVAPSEPRPGELPVASEAAAFELPEVAQLVRPVPEVDELVERTEQSPPPALRDIG
ncbi:DNA recombination protein RmuC [Propionicicella superfundia]|uniref:DNA recombination protein RmuC n=1 Tax=Propionicicella superfundia TaxID=348582 RepID=UPI0006841157|nr:DNA recombination protein RmuC [Propionicicella superfundia]